MKLKPYEWNSVIAGSWNPAIFTPQGIAKLLFEKPDNTPIEVMVPLNGIGPVRVSIDDFIVTTDLGRLVIQAKNAEYVLLDKTRAIAIKAIDELPKTPLNAAGFNIRYRLEDASEGFLQLLEPTLDKKLSDASIKILSKEVRRSLEFKEGNINFYVSEIDASSYTITINFNKTSAKQEALVEWLKIEISEVKSEAEKIICNVLNINKEEIE